LTPTSGGYYIAERERIDPVFPIARQMTVLCVLPARLDSERIPRKPLQIIAGRPLVEWSWNAACAVPGVDEVVVATDSEEIAAAVERFGGTSRLTRADHASGTDRVAEAAEHSDADIVVNFQADEPFLEPEAVRMAVDAVAAGPREVATLAVPIANEAEWRSAAVVKVARAVDGRALYFSRAPIPHPRDAAPDWAATQGAPGASPWLRHVGLYVYTRRALARWVALPPSMLEGIERLEQLRALEDGLDIEVCVVPRGHPGVDVPEDIARADRLLRGHDNAQRKRETHV
jgi:3-deoxy-manno-octulosonate cytidylyltransferase (CMP-KDO synthetase)